MVKEDRIFNLTILFTLILKLFLSYFFPLTGDEAYFITTSKNFDFGYYEHPPMIWWLLYIFSFFGRYTFHFFYYRLFSVFSTTLIGILLFRLISYFDKKKAYLISSLFLLSPLHLFNFLITNDIPLIFFTFLSAFFFYYGIKNDKKIYFLISGIFGGLSFLSKYFAFLYFLSILIYTIYRKEKKLWRSFAIFIISALPFIFINLYWNYTHCWINFLFNLIYRKKKEFFKVKNIILFFISILFLITPYFFKILLESKFFLKRKFLNNIDFFFFIFFIPLVFLFLLSFLRRVGLHWYISFLPFSFILLEEINMEKILKSIKVALIFDLLIFLLISSILILPFGKFKNHKKYPHILMFLKPDILSGYLESIKENYIFATTGYTESAIMSYYTKIPFIVFGSLSASGRQYDISFDFKKIDGKDILIFSLEDIDVEKFSDFFERINKEKVKIFEGDFYLLFCKKFNYKNYREKILRKTYEKFYKIPEFLPAKGNFFKEKYNF